jgi:hypothetical protein
MARILKRLFNDQALMQENFNEIINVLTGVNSIGNSVDFSANTITFTDSLEGTTITLTKDNGGFITNIKWDVQEVTSMAPFSNDGSYQRYENSDIKNMDALNSDYALFKSDGTLIPKTDYEIDIFQAGITFSTSQTYQTVFLSNMIIINTLEYNLHRDGQGTIQEMVQVNY